mgnify:FL=1|jgi:hypothetical protein|tara:strand:- start:3018 stop:4196 length:1179 start_codon:yes stop_codon:yes gene_type:complete
MQKLFFTNQNRFQLISACIGLAIGLILLLSSIQLYHKAKLYNEESEMLDAHALIIQKQVSRASHLGLGSPNFSKSEIEGLKSQEFILACSPIISNQFEVVVAIDDPVIPAFNSNIFLQSIENEFINISPTYFGWNDSSDFVPVVMPRNFLIMLNTFLSASQLPQLSESLVSNVQMNLMIGPRSKRTSVPARIVGFTNTFSSILVPSTFMKKANLKYADTQNQFHSQIIIKPIDKKLGLLESYLKEMGYESGEDQLFVSRLKSALSLTLMFMLSLAVLTLSLSIIIMIQYLQLMLSSLSFEIRLMLRLGHSIKTLKSKFFRYFMFVFILTALISFGSFYFLSLTIDDKLISSGILIKESTSIWTVVSLLAVFIIFAITVDIYTTRKIKAQFFS